METYTIAQYFTDDQKRAACAKKYYPESGETPRTVEVGKDGAKFCPLGVAINGYFSSPSPVDVANEITIGNMNRWRAIEYAAQEFIDDWDFGRISPADLPIALGLTNEETSSTLRRANAEG